MTRRSRRTGHDAPPIDLAGSSNEHDAAIETLATIGAREREVDEATILAISTTAADERRRIANGDRRAATEAPGRWRVAGAAVAAAAVIIAVAAGTLARPEQVVVTGELDPAAPAAAVSEGLPDPTHPSTSATSTPAAVDADTQDAIRAAPPTISEQAPGDTSPATAVQAETNGQAPEATDTAPTSAPPQNPPTTAEAPPTTAATTTSSTVASPGQAPVGAPLVAFPVGAAGTVELNVTNSVPTIGAVSDGFGWAHSISTISSNHLVVSFGDGRTTASFEVQADDTGFRILIDPDGYGQRGFIETRMYDFGAAGTAVVGYGYSGLTTLDVRPAPGWRPVVATPATNLLDVELVGPPTSRRYTTELRVGSIFIDIAGGG
ncbi:MAG: hypothetical protein ACR2QO_28290 [Acidimicrobiales bacterium]